MIPAGSEILGTVGLSKFEDTYALTHTDDPNGIVWGANGNVEI